MDRGAVAQHIFTQAEDKLFDIWISGPVVAEVHKYSPGLVLSTDDDTLIAFFQRRLFQWIVVDMQIGIDANRLCRNYGVRPFDALHIACALRARCYVLLTWDDDLSKVQIPGIRIEAPQVLGQTKMPLP